jgi:hypothetical protein
MAKERLNQDIGERIGKAIEQSLPAEREYIRIGNEQVFNLCVNLQKFLPKNTPEQELKPIFDDFWAKADGGLKDEHQNDLDYEDAWDQFQQAWPKVKYAGILQKAIEKAQNSPIRPELSGMSPKCQRLGMLAYHWQMIVGEENSVCLSSYDAAEFLGDRKKQRQALRQLDLLCTKGILKKNKSGNFTSHESNEYRYVEHNK